MNTDTITDRVIAVDFGMSLPNMIAAGKYDWVNPGISTQTFPIKGTGTKRFRTKLFVFGLYISSENAVAAMQKKNFRPGSRVHGLTFGAMFPDEQCKHSIACLGSSAQVDDGRSVLCLRRHVDGRGLDLGDWRGGWSSDWRGRWRFLCVQEVSDA